MNVRIRAFRLPKAGTAMDDYEDAFWPAGDVDTSGDVCRVAVADGATEASFSALWAQLLVTAFGQGGPVAVGLEKSLLRLRKMWLTQVTARPLPWYAEEKLRSGAAAAFIGLTLRRMASPASAGGTWETLAAGDSCLFQVRDDAMIAAFPIVNADDFTSWPRLLSSNRPVDEQIDDHIIRTQGHWAPGDEFYLMTDALACWFLQAAARQEKPWQAVRRVSPASPSASPPSSHPPRQTGRSTWRARPVRGNADSWFEGWIEGLRREGTLRNDDVTLLHVTVT